MTVTWLPGYPFFGCMWKGGNFQKRTITQNKLKKRIRSIKKNPKDNTIMPIWGNFGGVYSILWVLRNSKTKLAKAIFRNKIIQDEGKVVDSPLNTFTFFQARHCIHVCSTIHFRCSSLAYTVGVVGSLPAYYFDRLRFAVTPAVSFHISTSRPPINVFLVSAPSVISLSILRKYY